MFLPQIDGLVAQGGGRMADNAKRCLKVCETGNFYRGDTKLSIRLDGKWLKSAGFSADDKVEVFNPGAGVLVIKLSPTVGGQSAQD